ncbi:MAG TPA: hypothetical protein VIM11_06630 [Tepidisphaeraceae bacterium]|jgi:cbb3-type cytochrome oxidase subunit 3
MFKEIFNHIDLGRVGETGLLMFFAIFVCVIIYTFTRRRGELDYWANLPLNGNAPAESNDEAGVV